MAQVSISIPDRLIDWAGARIADGHYDSPSAYFGDLVQRDQTQVEARQRLQTAIDEGRASRETDATIDSIIAEGRARHAKG